MLLFFHFQFLPSYIPCIAIGNTFFTNNRPIIPICCPCINLTSIFLSTHLILLLLFAYLPFLCHRCCLSGPVRFLTREECYRGPGSHPSVKGFNWFTDGSKTVETNEARVFGQSLEKWLTIPLGKHATVFQAVCYINPRL